MQPVSEYQQQPIAAPSNLLRALASLFDKLNGFIKCQINRKPQCQADTSA